MEIKKGTVIGWNKEKNSLIVLLQDDQRIEIEQSEFSIYNMIAPDGVPFEVLWLIGKEISFAKFENGKYSRKALMRDTMEKMKVGDIFQAKIVSLKEKYIFLEILGCFFHCGEKEISKSFFKSASEYFYIGQTIDVKLLSKGSSTQYAEVSYKQAFPDSLENYTVGDFCMGKVSSVDHAIQAYFVNFSPSVSGLLDFQRCPSSFPSLSYGDEILCKVIGISKIGLKLSLQKVLHSK